MGSESRGQATRAARPTREDVARLANVSAATVSYVLNNVQNQTISKATRDAVHRAASQLGYRPNLAARNLAHGVSGVVLYVIPNVALGELAVRIASELSAALAQRGIIMSVQFDTEDPQGIVDALENLHPVAVTSALPLSERATAVVAAAGVKLLQFAGQGVQGIEGLNQAVGEAQVSHLIARGHRQLAFASSDVSDLDPLNELRLQAVREACDRQGLPVPLVGTLSTDGSNASTLIRAWRAEGVTAICAYNDDVAMVALHGLRQAGLRCPEDMAVIGTDANPVGFVSDPPLTSVGFDPHLIVELSVAGLLTALGFETTTAGTIGRETTVTVLERASA
ncbi:MAG TPA: LacI family DNA-binding transcriptional regulator [Lacisediminihabitans sp.]|uniref:LacI family DNA-binding transcriptional regulator n=1 Tax=Lacisediminihabitans sp. TaxID=2787631 RepID=UPI002ED7BAC4